MTTNNYYQVNVNNVQGNVNIQINTEKTETVSSPPGPEKHREQLPKYQTTWALEAFSFVGLLFIKTLDIGIGKILYPASEFLVLKVLYPAGKYTVLKVVYPAILSIGAASKKQIIKTIHLKPNVKLIEEKNDNHN